MWKQFFLRFAATATVLLLAAAALNLAVDPYDIYGGTRIVGFTATPYKSEDTERMTKPIQMNGRRIETLILGNSKADFAIDPAAWRELTGEQDVYDAAMRDGRLGESRQMLAHAIATHPELRRVLLAIDYESFRDDLRLTPAFDEAQAASSHITPANVAKTIWSQDAVRDSLLTLRENHRRQSAHPVYAPDGKFHADELALIFGQEDDFYKNLHGMVMAQRENAATERDVPYEELAAIRDLCAAHGIELVVFVPPVHPLQAQGNQSDLADYAAWLARASAIVPFVDFVLAPGTDDDADYWDTAHPKDRLGARVLTRLAGQGDASFGRYVTAETAAAHLAWQRQQLAAWQAQHPERQAEYDVTVGWGAVLPEGDVLATAEPIDLPRWNLDRAPEGSGRMDRSGTVPFRARDVRAVYAVLEAGDGRTLYSRMQKSRDDDIMRQEIFHDIRRDPCRYVLTAPAPALSGTLRVIVLLHDGRAVVSGTMETW
ncbi:hypothetical protein [uncultured Selenomonas sp.]|uniref:hypothetical protein n=1 Tax=uncultured Selenomonas sp. TaxID=159275 RepID=UPI0025E64C8A|nr:hypothetical protein [uncultured Selenomonas sp.]